VSSDKKLTIGFVMTRFSGTDGVSLETRKWIQLLEATGHRCTCFCGENDYLPDDAVRIEPLAHFKHDEIWSLNEKIFTSRRRDSETSTEIERLTGELKDCLHHFLSDFGIDLVIAENALSLPMNLPLGVALTRVAAETRIPVIGHHHDFWWERKRFLSSHVRDYIDSAFPPTLSKIQHVVINSVAGSQLAFRKGCSPQIVPNVMDFGTPPPADDGYAEDLRDEIGIEPGQYMLLQPTRIVPRKRIEDAIELTASLDSDAVLVVTHEAGDEGEEYLHYLEAFTKKVGANVRFATERFQSQRGTTEDGRQVYSLTDAYRACDLVTYPSLIEGFGNAFLETVYHRKPIVMSAYEIFTRDIEPKGFQVIEYDGFITPRLIDEVEAVLENPGNSDGMVEENFRLGKTYYSFESLQRNITSLLNDLFGYEVAEDG